MPGKPKLQAFLRRVKEQGGDEALLRRVEQGETLTAIAESFGISRPQLSIHLNRTPDSKERLTLARETAAHALADESLERARNTTEDNHRSSKVILSQLNHLAGKWNRAVYGEQQLQITNNIDLGSAFVAAMRATRQAIEQPQHLVVEGETAADNQGE